MRTKEVRLSVSKPGLWRYREAACGTEVPRFAGAAGLDAYITGRGRRKLRQPHPFNVFGIGDGMLAAERARQLQEAALK